MSLAELGISVCGGVAPSVFSKIKKHVNYIYKYKDNGKTLEDAKAQLDAKRKDANHFKDKIEREVKDVAATVSQWMNDADKLDGEAKKIRTNISCLNLWSRYSASKHAWKLTQDINKKVQDAPDFGTSFDLPIREGPKFNLRGFTDFNSRTEILKGVLEALKDDSVSMCSICGMGGIGKTTLAKKLVQIVEDEDLFDKVAMVTVSQNPAFEKIQKEIIEKLGLKPEVDTMAGRANKLNDWLSKHKTLLILDDVWEQLEDEKYDEVGIPVGNKGCKILVTSRNINECTKMGSNLNFSLNDLKDGEAWDLFIEYVEKSFEGGNLLKTATDIVKECHGLPIAIITVARALKDKPASVWRDSLRKLRKSIPQGMEKVHSRIQLSYDLLPDEEAQSCFRLCCLFPEDYDVPIEKLVFYMWGLELFKGVDSLKEARDSVDSIIHKLKDRFLLLDGKGDGYVKLHDIVRDFAISISSEAEYPFLVCCEEEMKKWPETSQLEKCGAISIVCDTIKDGIPLDFRCPNLKLLQLNYKDGSSEPPMGDFEETKELRVLDLKVPSPPVTIQKKLRTLLIYNRQYYNQEIWKPIFFREMLEMKNLEIFSLSSASFSEFPEEIGQLHNLKCLRFNRVSFEYMPPGVLSKLVKLEELEMPLEFKHWGLKEERGDRVNASLNEIESLPLTSIIVGVPKGSVLVEKIVKVAGFQIAIGSCHKEYGFGLDSNVLQVQEVDACDVTSNRMSSLVRNCDWLKLKRVRELKYIMFQPLRGKNGFPFTYFSRMKTLKIKKIDSLEEIWHGPYLPSIPPPCFPNLTDIEILNCPKLKRVFPLSVATQLTHLHHMRINYCEEMEEIFYKDQVDHGKQAREVHSTPPTSTQPFNPNDNPHPSHQIMEERKVDVIVSPPLRLRLGGMHKLRILHIGNLATESSSSIAYSNLLKAFFSRLDVLTIWEMNSLEKILFGPCFHNLTRIYVECCPKLKHMFPLSLATQLRQLQKMEITKCEVEEIFYIDQVTQESGVDHVILWPRLKELRLDDMPQLRNLCNGNHAIECPSLEFMQIYDCNDMEALSSGSLYAPSINNLTLTRVRHVKNIMKFLQMEQHNGLSQLRRLWIESCHEIKYLVDATAFFSCLKDVTIQRLNSLEEIWHGPYSSNIQPPCFHNMTHFGIWSCPKLKHVFPLSVATELTQLQQLEISSCDEVEEIFYIEQIMEGSSAKLDEKEADDDAMDVIIFPQLKFLSLWKLSKLRIFYDGNHALELPSLEHLDISGCNEIDALSKGSFNAPKLKEINRKKYHQFGEDLNTILRDMLNKDKDIDNNEAGEESEDEDDDDNDAEAEDEDDNDEGIH